MYKTACVFALTALSAAASAGIDIYITRAADQMSMLAPDTFNTNEKDFLPNYVPPRPDLPHGPFTQARGTTATYFIWADFSGYGDGYLQLFGLDLRGSYVTGAGAIGQSVLYRHRHGPSYQRWDNTGPRYFPGWASGVGLTHGVFAPATDDIQTSADGVTHALLGAFEFSSGDTASNADLHLAMGGGFVAVRSPIVEWSEFAPLGWYPSLSILCVPVTYSGHQQVLAVSCVPEPAAALLLGLAGFWLRRR